MSNSAVLKLKRTPPAARPSKSAPVTRAAGGLASYAMRAERSQGRRYPEPAHAYRSEYVRDRDRIIHSRAFRRLEDKTQVFSRRFSDHFRTRLTHTLEVAQIARTVAGALGLNAELAEALALVHDVGHPPFGHTGEAALDRVMQRYGERFDHNLHALRIVERFEQKYAAFPGLNLTFEVREGIIKHSRDYDPALYRELAEYRLSERPPLEAQLIDLVDEVAYNTADLDDGYEARLLTLEMIREEVPLFDRFLRQVDRRHPDAAAKLRFNEALKGILDALATDLIDSTAGAARNHGIRTVDDVRASARRLAVFSSARVADIRGIKDFLRRRLYEHPSVHRERREISRRVESLFDYFVANPRRLPAAYYLKTREEPPHRIVCDYIAGMTDNYLREQWARCLGS
ncbi:MAG TPA: deoxyguanosinetriphosphate triphosphohydrolase [Terriglobia bacterium]|nr:deoxyguanosinetriphosphate triphosphohydrolase [Terriglobia bacterium]